MMQPKIQKITATLPEDQGRVETGPLQVNDDWPGVFIRGDSAFHYALQLTQVIDVLKDHGTGALMLKAVESLKSLMLKARTGEPF